MEATASETSTPGSPHVPGRQRSGGVDLTTGSVWRHLVRLSVPMLAGSAIQTGYNFVNAVWVGRGLGTDAMAAITVSFPIFFLLMAVAGGLTQAAAIMVAQAFGAGETARVRQVVQNAAVLTLGVASAGVIAGVVWAEPMLRLMATPESVLPLAVSYMRLFILTVPCMFGLFLLSSLLRGVGDATTPLHFQMVALCAAAVLDPVLMFGWLGFPRLGLEGTAWASIASQGAALVALFVTLRRRQHIVCPDWVGLAADRKTTWSLLQIGVPSMLQQAMISVGMMVLTGLVNAYGPQALAAFGVAIRIDQLAFMPAMAVGMAASSFAGQNLGAGRPDRVRRAFWAGLALAGGMTLLAAIVALVMPERVLRLFAEDPTVISLGVGYLHRLALAYLMFAVMFVSNGIINGAGHTVATTFFTLAGMWLVRLPLATWLSNHYQRIEYVWLAMVVGFFVGMVLSMAYYASGRWARGRNAIPGIDG